MQQENFQIEEEFNIDEESNIEEEQDRQLESLQTLHLFLKRFNTEIHGVQINPKKKGKIDELFVLGNFLDLHMADHIKLQLKKLRTNLIYFEIDVVSIRSEQEYFKETIFIQKYQQSHEFYFAYMIFNKVKTESVYRVHVEFWKFSDGVISTNELLSCYERSCMHMIQQELKREGLITHRYESAVKLKTFRPTHRTIKKRYDQPINIVDKIKEHATIFLEQMISVIQSETECEYCKTFMNYESSLKMLAPPTIIIKQKFKKPKYPMEEQQTKQYEIYHEDCVPRYFEDRVVKNFTLSDYTPPTILMSFQKHLSDRRTN